MRRSMLVTLAIALVGGALQIVIWVLLVQAAREQIFWAVALMVFAPMFVAARVAYRLGFDAGCAASAPVDRRTSSPDP